MKIVAFTYTKISGERHKKLEKVNMNTDIQIVDIQKEESNVLKDKETASLTFAYELTYNSEGKKDSAYGKIRLEGRIMIALSQEESKEMWKSWKKKELADSLRSGTFNFILAKCTTKALVLQEELGLPHNIPFPRISFDKPKQ